MSAANLRHLTTVLNQSHRFPAMLLAVFVLSLITRITWIILNPPVAEQVLTQLADSTDYDLLARSILSGIGFVGPGGEPSVIRPPLYPLLIAAVYTLFGAGNLMAVAMVQAVMGGIGSVLTSIVARQLGAPRWAGLLAGVADALYPVFVYQSVLILTEAPHRPIQMAAVSLTLLLARHRHPTIPVLAGVAWGVAALSRPVALAGLPLIIIWCLISAGWRAGAWRSALVGLGMLLAIGPWAARNAVVSGRFIPVAANLPVTAVHGTSRLSVHAMKWYAPGQLIPVSNDLLWHTQLRAFNGAEQELAQQAVYKSILLDFAREHPGRLMALSLRRALQFWSPVIENRSRMARIAALASMAPVLIIGWWGVLAGLRSTRRSPRWRGALLCLFIALATTLPHALTMCDVRYRTAHIDALWIAAAAVAVGCTRMKKPTGKAPGRL